MQEKNDLDLIVAAIRAAYADYCLEQQLGDWDPNPSADRLVELFLAHTQGADPGLKI